MEAKYTVYQYEMYLHLEGCYDTALAVHCVILEGKSNHSFDDKCFLFPVMVMMVVDLPGGLVVVTLPILDWAVPPEFETRSCLMSPAVERTGLLRERREQLSSQSTPSLPLLFLAVKVHVQLRASCVRVLHYCHMMCTCKLHDMTRVACHLFLKTPVQDLQCCIGVGYQTHKCFVFMCIYLFSFQP